MSNVIIRRNTAAATITKVRYKKKAPQVGKFFSKSRTKKMCSQDATDAEKFQKMYQKSIKIRDASLKFCGKIFRFDWEAKMNCEQFLKHTDIPL